MYIYLLLYLCFINIYCAVYYNIYMNVIFITITYISIYICYVDDINIIQKKHIPFTDNNNISININNIDKYL
jgi:hypothetical protein